MLLSVVPFVLYFSIYPGLMITFMTLTKVYKAGKYQSLPKPISLLKMEVLNRMINNSTTSEIMSMTWKLYLLI